MRAIILGCGTAGGVPRIGDDWGSCNPDEPRNRRRRASIAVEHAGTRLLVDTSPDLRMQAIDCGIDRVDAVLYTHDHADHTHGIDDLRFFAIRQRREIDIYGDRRTLDSLRRRFGYVFRNGGPLYPPIAQPHEIDGPFRIGPIDIAPFLQDHASMTTLGFRFGPIAYSTDAVRLSEEAFRALDGVRVWIVDALQEEPHLTHAHLERTMAWIARVKPERAVLTHMNYTLDYGSLKARLPDGIEPAYDGMRIEVD
ncbi:MAG: MBL fold metallo-hydrolase [Alphaproteobacteria bacterium]|nr:MBL fold metallo-hydrolase [Alphaproteobacteria bacterium]